jgi:hypothetical protein
MQESSLSPRTTHVLGRLRHARLWLLLVLGSVAIVLFPWTAYLSATLPSEHVTHHWQVAWAGFDLFEAAALVATFVAMLKRSAFVTVAASVAGTALLCDAWFDLVTAQAGREFWWALLFALVGELPLAALCFWIAFEVGGSWTLSSPRTRFGQLTLHPQRREADPGKSDNVLVHEVAGLPAREELGVEAMQPLDLEEGVGNQ